MIAVRVMFGQTLSLVNFSFVDLSLADQGEPA
jgi:hypothetical protein